MKNPIDLGNLNNEENVLLTSMTTETTKRSYRDKIKVYESNGGDLKRLKEILLLLETNWNKGIDPFVAFTFEGVQFPYKKYLNFKGINFSLAYEVVDTLDGRMPDRLPTHREQLLIDHCLGKAIAPVAELRKTPKRYQAFCSLNEGSKKSYRKPTEKERSFIVEYLKENREAKAKAQVIMHL